MIRRRESRAAAARFLRSIGSAMEGERQASGVERFDGARGDVQTDQAVKERVNTLSTKLSTDQLICKTPQESPSVSVKSLKTRKRGEGDNQRIILFLGVLQFVLGFLMVAFGILVIVHRATLSQVNILTRTREIT